MIRFRCTCGKKLKAEPAIIGKKVRCTRCQKVHIVPSDDQLTPKPAAEVETSKASPKLPSANIASADDSSSRFKLPPESPEPSSSSGQSSSAFDFDIDILTEDRQQSMLPDSAEDEGVRIEPVAPAAFQRKVPVAWAAPRRVLPVIGILGLVILVVAGGWWWMNSGPPFPDSFESMTEVSYYRNTTNQLRKAQHTFTVMREAYLETAEPTEDETEELQTIADELLTPQELDAPLYEAYRLLNEGQEMKAKALLVARAKWNQSRVPELEARAQALAQQQP